jgi:polyribonucleotide nucleotidyltransferase
VARVQRRTGGESHLSQIEEADIEIIVAATLDNILMVEGEMKEVSEAEMLEAIKFAHEAIKPMCQAQLDLTKKTGKEEKREYSHESE